MKVKIKQQITGTRDGVNWPAPGETMIVPDAEGADLCSLGIAEPVAEVAQPERRESKPAAKRAARKPKE